MAHVITANLTFSSQANRDAAKTRVINALASYTYANFATTLPAGINTPTSTTLTISVYLNEPSAARSKAAYDAIYAALTLSGRATSGWAGIITS